MILNSKKKNILFAVALTILCCTSFFSCTADDEIILKPVSNDYISAARKVLQDSFVVNATAMQGTVNKTLLDKGCPLKYYVKWKNATSDTINIQLKGFSVGKMPVTIWFSINCKFMQLNSWEKEEYTEEGWIKFQGTGGTVRYTGNENDEDDSYESGSGGAGSVTGYFNAVTNEIEFVTNFNVMNMSSDVYRQVIDPARIKTFDADFAQYEKDLAEYKKEHHIS